MPNPWKAPEPRRRRSRLPLRRGAWATAAAVACTVALPLAASGAVHPKRGNVTARSRSSFDLGQLVARARAEGSVTVWDSSSSVLKIAKNFEKKYGITVDAQKMSATSELTKLQALAGSGGQSADVVLFATGPALVAQLINEGTVKSWVPPDLDIPTKYQNPLVYLWQPAVFYYNTSVYGGTCPVQNIWQLTEPQFRGRVAMDDPTQVPEMLEWFAEMAINDRNQLAAAYKEEFHKPYTGSNAGYTFIQELAKNAPLVESSLTNVLQAVGGPGVTNPAIGLAHGSTYKDAQSLGYHVGICRGMTPWIGYMYPKFIVKVAHTPHPYAADLFIHFAMTAAGNAPAASGGSESGNLMAPRGTSHAPPGLLLAEHRNRHFEYLSLKSLDKDFRMLKPLAALWLENLAAPS